MKNKVTTLILAGVLLLMSAYYLSFTFISRSVVKDADEFATIDDKVDALKKQIYLDSVWKEPVFNLLGMDYTFKQIKETELNLGLDLQGGMSVTLEVSTGELLKILSGNNTNPTFNKALQMASQAEKKSQEDYIVLFQKEFEKLDPNASLSAIFQTSSNKEFINYNSKNDEVIKYLKKEIKSAIDIAFEVIKTRIDKFGVTQPNIQKIEGTSRIYIELPGVDNPERVRKLLQGTAQLEFFEVWEPKEYITYLKQLNDALAFKYKSEEAKDTLLDSLTTVIPKKDSVSQKPKVKQPVDTLAELGLDSLNKPSDTLLAESQKDSTAKDSATQAKNNPLFWIMPVTENGTFCQVKDTARLNRMFGGAEAKKALPPNFRLAYEIKSLKGNQEQDLQIIHFLKTTRDGKPALGGDVIVNAAQDVDQGKPIVSMQMNKKGAKEWKRTTENNIGRKVAIVLDGYIYSAPVVQGAIPNGRSQISGNFTIDEAQDLANVLKAGKLPAPTRIIEEAIVGPTLGAETIRMGMFAMGLSLFLVIIYMIFYYNISGSFADFSLVLNVFIILGVLSQFAAALTLPGIAGIVLTMGMAVDANVIIYERIKEELKLGKNLINAIQQGFDRALSAIIDGNATTFLIGIILYLTGSGPIKGFAITLMIGIITTLFTAIFITRLLIDWFAMRENNKILKFDTLFSKGLFEKINLNVIGNRKIAYIFSSSVIGLGLILMIFQSGLTYGVDFLGGRSYVVTFDKDIVANEVRQSVKEAFGGTGTEVKTFNQNNQLKITTTYLIDDNSDEADLKVRATLEKGLEKVADLHPVIGSSQKVGSTIADDIKNSAFWAIVLSLIVIFLYVLIRFHKWQYSLGATVALFHDVLFVFAMYAIVGLFGIHYEVDQAFVAAILTVIGYSINDTVIIFDRIREHVTEHPRANLAETMNEAINRTFGRTINTSLTTLLVVVVLFIMGGDILKGFSFALLVGITIGTYSSIFIASPLTLDTIRVKTLKQ